MAYEIKVTGGQMVDDAQKVLDEEERNGILNEVASEPEVVAEPEPAPISVDSLESVEPAAEGEVSSEESYWDRFQTSKVKTWNPQTNSIEETETPTWRRAARGVANGLKNYGLTLLKSGGDEGQAWAAGIESAFGDLDSEKAAVAKGAAFEKQFNDLVGSGKYTPASLGEFRRTGNTSVLKFEKSEMSAREVAQTQNEGNRLTLDKEKLVEQVRSAKVDERISQQNANTSSYNAQTQRWSAENSLIEVDGADFEGGVAGNKYIVPYNAATQTRGKPILKDTDGGRKLLEQQKGLDQNIAKANVTLELVDEMLNDKNLEHAVGTVDGWLLTTRSGTGNFEANHDVLKSQNFLNSISQMKGMGALSDAEGAKLEQAIAGLKLNMPSKAYRKQLAKVKEHYIKLVEANNKERGESGNTSTENVASKFEALYK